MREQTAKKYVQAIYFLQEEGAARGTGIAREMGLSKATVSIALKTLADDGYIVMDHGHAVRLTARGLLLAREAIYETVHRGRNLHSYLDKITTEVETHSELAADEDLQWLLEEKLTAALETLLVLKKHYFRVRTADLADALDIAVTAAAEQILQLEERGFAKRGERDCITLTERGARYAETFYVGHATQRYRLMGEGMPEQEAELLACTMQKDVP